MAATSTTACNTLLIQYVKSMAYIVYQNVHFQRQGMHWWHQQCHWMNDLQPLAAVNSSSKPGKTALSWTQINILVILQDQTMNTHFLSTLQGHTMRTGSTWIPFHLCNMLLHCHFLLHTWKKVLSWRKSLFWPLILHQTLNTHFVSHWSDYSADWLHLNTLSPMEYALPQTTRLPDTWKNFHDECQQTFWSFLLNQTINIDFLSTKQ